MKRICSLFLALALMFSLSACGSKGEPTSPDVPAESLPPVQQEDTAAPEQEEPDATPDVTEETDTGDTHILVAYFTLADIVPEGADAVSSATPSQGNTRTAAAEIASQTGGDLFQITTSNTYPVSHSEASGIAEDELRADARPPLTSQVENMEQYDVVFVGYPIWWYTSPMVIRSFLEAYDFSGKTIVPFCTTLGAGVGQSVDEIRELCPDAAVLDGLTLSTGRAERMQSSISDWLNGLDLGQ